MYKKEEVLKYVTSNDWDLGNKQLYQLCKKYPKHKKTDEIVAKIWLIGRAYSAAIERRKADKNKPRIINDDFYLKVVAPQILNANIDDYFIDIKNQRRISQINILNILLIHKKILNVFSKITKHKNRSLASKYLHFHFPELFFIYDTRAKGALNKLYLSSEPNLNLILKHNRDKIDVEYARFFIKCYMAKIEYENLLNRKITVRQMDNILIAIANKSLKKKKI